MVVGECVRGWESKWCWSCGEGEEHNVVMFGECVGVGKAGGAGVVERVRKTMLWWFGYRGKRVEVMAGCHIAINDGNTWTRYPHLVNITP